MSEKWTEVARYRGGAIKGTKGKILRTLAFGTLTATDRYQMAVNYGTALAEELYSHYRRKGWKKHSDIMDLVKKNFKDPPKKVAERAADKAAEWLFREKLDTASEAYTRLVKKIPALQLVTPFVKTPVNVMKNPWRRIPILGLMGKNYVDLKTGGRAASEAIARQMAGAIAVAAGYGLIKNGLIEFTGGAPTSQDEKSLFYAARKLPWAFRIKGTNRWISLQGLEPLAAFFKIIIANKNEIDKYVSQSETDPYKGSLFWNALGKTTAG